MAENETFSGVTLAWLLEEDDPGVRYLAMRDLLDLPSDDTDLIKARQIAHQQGPIFVRGFDQVDSRVEGAAI